LQIIDLERRDFLGIEGIGEEDADRLLQLIDELTVVEGEGPTAGGDDGEVGSDAVGSAGEEGEAASEDEGGAAVAVETENESDDSEK
jgi:hypothetical protein